jgi:hypothetical protein
MITLKKWMEVVNYRISEGSDYCWDCYGNNAHRLDAWNGKQDGHSHSIIFDTKTQEVYEVTCYDYRNNRAYRFINPEFVKKHKKEAKRRSVEYKEAWDDVNYTDLEVEEDFIEKATAVENEELDYDARVQVPLTLDKEQMYDLMQMAHERDITLNQLVEIVLREEIKRLENENGF